VLTFFRQHRDFGRFSRWQVTAVEARDLLLVGLDGERRRLDPRLANGYDVGTGSELPIAVGDRLLIRANLTPAGLRNGEIVEVAHLTSAGDIGLKDGRTLPAWFREFTHGYCATSHASQGKTVDRGILLMGAGGIAAGSIRQAYVSNSRFRESQVIFTVDKAEARDAMARPGDRKLAMELIGVEPPPRRQWRQQWLEQLRRAISPRAA
jgi:ATP-dependent exoDNAse (exonuclease V) alpha subunit